MVTSLHWGSSGLKLTPLTQIYLPNTAIRLCRTHEVDLLLLANDPEVLRTARFQVPKHDCFILFE